MNQRIKKLWIKALRSGEYEQGFQRLLIEGVDYDRFCCLGVLTDLYVQETGKSNAWGGEGNRGTILTRSVVKWSELPSTDPSCDLQRLSNQNDRGKTFKAIADLIEKHL